MLKREEGAEVEPVAYAPVLPLLLINGCSAIATGFSTTVPTFNPADVLANVLRVLNGEAMQTMTPWFRGFRGSVTPDGDGKWRVTGVAAQEAHVNTWVVTELPPGVAFNKYAEWLQSDKSPATLLENRCNESTAYFKVRFNDAVPSDPMAALKLVDTVSSRNMYAFNAEGAVRKYDTPESILEEWLPWRLARYEERRTHLIAAAEEHAALLRNKRRFVAAVVAKQLVPQEYEEAALVKHLETAGYDASSGSYDYLLSIQTRSFTRDRAERLEREANDAQRAADAARATTAGDMWRADLEALA